jgi:outer membrane receptor protein involved in Fe transport
MFKTLVLKVFLAEIILLSFIQPINSQDNNQNSYLSFDQVIGQLEHKYPVQFFYKPEWFANKRVLASILMFPFDQILERIKTAAGLSVVSIDSVLYIFVPLMPESKLTSETKGPGEIIVGNPNYYGKYKSATIQGKILDGISGNIVHGATIVIDKLKLGANTDKNGDFHLQAPVGELDLKLSCIGFESKTQRIKLVSDGTLILEMFEKLIQLNEVVITAERVASNVSGAQMSFVKLDSKLIKELPVTLGETDIIKSITLMPGIQTVGEFGTGFNVRGGGADQNLILLQDVPLFNSSHVFGLISSVNSEGISDVTLLKAGIPAKYGERASSVLDIRMDANNPDKTSVKGGIGLIDSRICIETPLANKKVTLLLSARSSYSDWLLHSIPDHDLMNSSARFYDANALLSYNLNASNRIHFFAYFSNDQFGLGKNADYHYDNLLASVKWNHSFSNNLFFSLVGGLSNYNFNMSESDTSRPAEAYKIKTSLHYKDIKWNFTWLPNKNHAIDFGINSAFYLINPGELNPLFNATIIKSEKMQPEKAGEYAIYLTDNITLSPRFTLDIGLRYSLYTYLGPNKIYVYQPNVPKTPESIIDSTSYGNNKIICSYSGLEPRFSLRFNVSDNSSVKLSYNRIHQYVNLISNTAVMMPSDVWKLSSPSLKPLLCNHYAIGYFYNFKNNTIETSIELYYKKLSNAIDYKNGAEILLNPYIETDLINVRGKNMGVELYIKKNSGKLTGWASYTFSRSWQKTNGIFTDEKINNNQLFPSNYDRPNNLVINANYHLSRRWRFGSTFTYSTGRPVTLPEYKFIFQDYQLLYYSDRNKYRLPDYDRLDISLTLDGSLKIRKKWKGSWTFSIINLYSRKNAYSIFYKQEGHMVSYQLKEYDTYMLYIIGRPLPTLTYNFTF